MRTEAADGRERLFRLVRARLGKDISVEDFCREFERTYNFGVNEGELSPTEQEVFSELFDTVAWFTPLASERQELPKHFKDEKAVEAAVCKARLDLEIYPEE